MKLLFAGTASTFLLHKPFLSLVLIYVHYKLSTADKKNLGIFHQGRVIQNPFFRVSRLNDNGPAAPVIFSSG